MYNTGEARQEVVGEARRDEVWTDVSYLVGEGKIDGRSSCKAARTYSIGEVSLVGIPHRCITPVRRWWARPEGTGVD
jgi:hypothetical protein